MGTRHLICVVKDGEYKVAQYGQWDGYPSGQGCTVLGFLATEFDREEFTARLAEAYVATDEQINGWYLNAGATEKELAEGWINSAVSDRFKKTTPSLSRDTGGKILAMIQNSIYPTPLRNGINFAADSLMCEWAYVVDLDKNSFEIFKGFNTADPLKEGDRFYGFTVDNSNKEYFPVKLVAEYPLSDLPDEDTFLAELEPQEEEEQS